jgi:hypothetical protein
MTTIAQLKKKYAGLYAQGKTSGHAAPRRPPKEGSFTEVERAILLRNVIDALASRPTESPEFKIWHRYGLSRLYFPDHSWLSYSPSGLSIYGPDKTGTAYAVRCDLKLGTRAKKGAL